MIVVALEGVVRCFPSFHPSRLGCPSLPSPANQHARCHVCSRPVTSPPAGPQPLALPHGESRKEGGAGRMPGQGKARRVEEARGLLWAPAPLVYPIFPQRSLRPATVETGAFTWSPHPHPCPALRLLRSCQGSGGAASLLGQGGLWLPGQGPVGLPGLSCRAGEAGALAVPSVVGTCTGRQWGLVLPQEPNTVG